MNAEELTRRVRDAVPSTTDAERARMRRAVRDGLHEAAPARRRSRVGGAVAFTAAVGGVAAFFVLALPRGGTPTTPTGSAPTFRVLDAGAAFDPASVKLRVAKLAPFPGLQAGSLRLARTLSVGTKVVVGRASNGFVCLILVPPRTHFRGGACAPARDIGAAALVEHAWWGKRQTVLLVADGTRLESTAGRPYAVRANVAVLPAGVGRVVATAADGTRRELRLTTNASVPLSAADARALRPVVPDLAGLTPDQATAVLYAARLADGPVDARPTAGITPGLVVSQAVASGSEIAAGSEVGMVVASPVGPGGARPVIPPDTALRVRAASSRSAPAPLFADGTFRDLAGGVRVLVFVTTAADAARATESTVLPAGVRTTLVVRGDDRQAARVAGTARVQVVADRDGRLAAAAGVDQAPATVVLDRSGRVASRTPGLPVRSANGATALTSLVTLLRQEAFPPGSAPTVPAGLWLMRQTPPVPADRVPTFVRSFTSCPVHPERVWAFGPTTDGWRAWVGLSPDGASGTGVDVVMFTARGMPRGTRRSGMTGCGFGDDFPRRVRTEVALGMGTWQYGTQAGGLWIVRRGYTGAVADGRTWPVRNGLLLIEGSRLPATFTLVGPAGRRTVRVR